MARVDLLLGLLRSCDAIVSDDADADIVKVVVSKGCDIPFLFAERVAFIATGLVLNRYG